MDGLISRGFSLVEILVAMSIATLVMSGVVMGSGGFGLALSGQQSSVSDADLQAEAILLAEQSIQKLQAVGKQNVSSLQSTTTRDAVFEKEVRVTLGPDFLTRIITASVFWRNTRGATSSVAFTTVVPLLQNIDSPDTCGPPSGNWTKPQFQAPLLVDNPARTAVGNAVTDIDVFRRRMYVATDNNQGTSPDFYIYDVTDPKRPFYTSSLQTVTRRAGLNAITAASTTAGTYVYAASAYDPNWNTCTAGPNCSQLQVISIPDPYSPSVVAHYKLGTTTPPYVLGNVSGAGSGQAAGKSVVYKDGFLYLGLTTTSRGPGFHIFDVGGGTQGGTPASPIWISSWPSASLSFGSSGAPINGIYMHGDYAYLLHPAGLAAASSTLNEQITVLSVRDPVRPERVGGFFMSGGIGGNGKAAYQAGTDLYFGRTETSNGRPELLVLDAEDPEQLSARNANPAGRVVGETVTNVLVRGSLLYMLSNTMLELFDITDPATLNVQTPAASTTLATLPGLGAGSQGNALECEGNTLYLGTYVSAADKGAVVVITPTP